MSRIAQLVQLQADAPSAGLLSSWLIPMALIVVIYYFLLVAPARKRQRKTQEMLDNLKNGDRVVTSGGILGTIVRVNQGEESVRLRVAPSVEIEITRASVAGLQPQPPPQKS